VILMDTDNSDLAPVRMSDVFWRLLWVATFALSCYGAYVAYHAKHDFHRIGGDEQKNKRSSGDLSQRISSLEARYDALSEQNQNIKTSLSALVEQTQAALNQVGREIATDREQLITLTTQIKRLAESIGITSFSNTTVKAGAKVSASKISSAGGAASFSSNPVAKKPVRKFREYEVQPGETFSKIAKKQGVALQDLLEANPAVDPRSLRVGQFINVPVKST
jgi:LysM repeat protein